MNFPIENCCYEKSKSKIMNSRLKLISVYLKFISYLLININISII